MLRVGRAIAVADRRRVARAGRGRGRKPWSRDGDAVVSCARRFAVWSRITATVVVLAAAVVAHHPLWSAAPIHGHDRVVPDDLARTTQVGGGSTHSE
jgi:hypothetical protein